MRDTFQRGLLASLGLVLLGLAVPERPAVAASAVILSGDDIADPLRPFAERLKGALADTLPATLASEATGPGVLPAVANDPGRIAFAQRDGLAAFRSMGRDPGNVELYGEVPACVVALTRRDGVVRTYADLLAARRSTELVRMDVGAAEGWTASTLSILRAHDPGLAYATVEHRGGARAISRVLSGETDLLVVMAYGSAMDPAITDALAAGTLEPAPLFTTALVRMAALHGLPYVTGQVPVATPGLLAGSRDYETACTSLGVVVSANADRTVAEAVARVAVSGRLTASPRQWLDNAIKTATTAAGQMITEARRVATSVAEPGLAWLARRVALPETNAPEMRPASNLKDDGR